MELGNLCSDQSKVGDLRLGAGVGAATHGDRELIVDPRKPAGLLSNHFGRSGLNEHSAQSLRRPGHIPNRMGTAFRAATCSHPHELHDVVRPG